MLTPTKNDWGLRKGQLAMIRKNKCNHKMKGVFGMTLIELLLVVCLMALLALFSYPRLTQYILNSHRVIAQTDMLKLQLQLEQEYNQHYNWSSLIVGGVCLVCQSDTERFSFAISSSATMAYTITATALSDKGQDQDSCLPANNQMTLDAHNITLPNACWD